MANNYNRKYEINNSIISILNDWETFSDNLESSPIDDMCIEIYRDCERFYVDLLIYVDGLIEGLIPHWERYNIPVRYCRALFDTIGINYTKEDIDKLQMMEDELKDEMVKYIPVNEEV